VRARLRQMAQPLSHRGASCDDVAKTSCSRNEVADHYRTPGIRSGLRVAGDRKIEYTQARHGGRTSWRTAAGGVAQSGGFVGVTWSTRAGRAVWCVCCFSRVPCLGLFFRRWLLQVGWDSPSRHPTPNRMRCAAVLHPAMPPVWRYSFPLRWPDPSPARRSRPVPRRSAVLLR
jgi:hypothetical protein